MRPGLRRTGMKRKDFHDIPVALAVFLALGIAAPVSARKQPPKTPPGMARCDNPIIPSATIQHHRGELFEYDLELVGFSLGKATITAWQQGSFQGQSVTEYRAWIEPDSLISAVSAIEAQAFAIFPESSFTPVQSLTRYKYRGTSVEESQQRSEGGKKLQTTVSRNGKQSRRNKEYSIPVHDYLSGFLLLRGLPAQSAGCTVIYGEGRAYTVWITPKGKDRLDTSSGKSNFDRYELRYGSDGSRTIRTVEIWMTPGPEPIPFQAKGESRASPVVKLTGYKKGRG